MAPQATGGPLKKRWPPHKMVAPSNTDVKHRWNEIESIFMRMKHKKLLKHYEITKTENSRSRPITCMRRLTSILDFSKTATNFFIIHSLPKVDNIFFHLNLVSQLAALVCTIGAHGNIGNSKQSFIAIYRQEHA